MKTYISSALLALMAFPLMANASVSIWSDVNIEGTPVLELVKQASEAHSKAHKRDPSSYRNGIGVEAPKDTTESSNGPKKTTMLSGFEYEQHRYQKNPRQTLVSLIYADGKTKVTDNFALRYLFKEIQAYEGKDDNKVGPQKMHFEIAPRYEKWVSPNFNYAVEFAYENVSGGDNGPEKKYWVKPELAFTYGKHFLFVDLETRYLEWEKSWGVESEPLYLYSITDRLKVGGKVLYVDERTDFHWQEQAVKPLVQYRFENDLYVELRYEKGKTEIHDGTGYLYDNYAIYTEIPLTDNFKFLIDAAYRTGQENNGNEYTWGDRNGVFAKVGVISTF